MTLSETGLATHQDVLECCWGLTEGAYEIFSVPLVEIFWEMAGNHWQPWRWSLPWMSQSPTALSRRTSSSPLPPMSSIGLALPERQLWHTLLPHLADVSPPPHACILGRAKPCPRLAYVSQGQDHSFLALGPQCPCAWVLPLPAWMLQLGSISSQWSVWGQLGLQMNIWKPLASSPVWRWHTGTPLWDWKWVHLKLLCHRPLYC